MDFNCCLVTYGNKMTTLYETDLEQVQEELRFPLRSDDSDLRGSLKELELPLVIQTLTNARKQEFSICSMNNLDLSRKSFALTVK